MILAYTGRMWSRWSMISTGRERTQLGWMEMNSEQEMSKQETERTLVSVTICNNRRDSRGSASRWELGTWMVLLRAQYYHEKTSKQNTVTIEIPGWMITYVDTWDLLPDTFSTWSALTKPEFFKMDIQRRYLCGPFVVTVTLEALLHFSNFACMESTLSFL